MIPGDPIASNRFSRALGTVRTRSVRDYHAGVGLRVAFLSAECEPWAKTGGLADVVDALARAIGRVPDEAAEMPVDVFLPRYRGVPDPRPDAILTETVVAVPDPRARAGSTSVTIVDVAADGYRLRLVDHPPAFDRDGFYGDDAGDYTDNAWRFGLFARAALETLRAEGRRIDVLHLHDWQAGPAAVFRDRLYRDDPIIGRAALVMTLHNLAYHGWTPNADLPQLGLQPGREGAGSERRWHRPAGGRHRGRRDRQHRLTRLRGARS